MEFTYRARNRSGETEEGTMTAASRDTVGEVLREKGLLPTEIKESKTSRFDFSKIQAMLTRVSLLEKLTFIKNLGVTMRAGLPVAKALRVVTAQMPNKYFSEVVNDIADGVEKGKTISESMSEYPKIFSPIFINMVSVGEQSGELDKSLDYLAAQISRDYNLIRRTKGALIYPAVVLVALVVIGYLMFAFVLPKLTATFTEFEIELPLLTQIIITVVDIVSKYSILILVLAVVAVLALWQWRKTDSGKKFIHKWILRIPVVGKLIKKMNLARFTIIFSSLLKSGMPIVKSLRICGDTMTNIYYQKALHEASDKVKIGVDLKTVLEKHEELFTPMVTQMIQVGEESGTMEDVLQEVSEFYEAEIDDSVKNLSSIIEPVLVIVIGVFVGLLAVGLILPIYNIGTGI